MSEQWYLRMEAVNLCNFVYDTQDLSTIRGGGHILLSAVEEVREKYDSFLEKISSGASVGLFAIKEDTKAEDAVKEIRKFLTSDDDFKHATFVVNAVKETGTDNYRRDLERLMAANRWQQMRSPSYAVPSDKSSSTVCEVDLIRPTFDGKKISRSVNQRRKKGLEGKRKDFYEKISGYDVKGKLFVNDLDQLTGDGKKPLHHKMAVIYIDGNGFGKIQDDKCKSPDTHEEFDNHLSKKYKEFMCELFQHIDNNKRDWFTPNGAYRLETLLWGGDERMWVVPAWKGWELLQFFFEHTRDWHFDKTEKRRLTHAAGIVFCHHKAPIHRITALARGLADQAKIAVSRSRNAFAYQILESFDHVGRDLAGFRAERCPSGETTASLVLGGNDMGRIAEAFGKLHSTEFSTSRLHRVVSALLAPGEPSRVMADELIEELKKELSIADSNSENILNTLEPLLGGKRTMWVHLAELWNYIAPKEAAKC